MWRSVWIAVSVSTLSVWAQQTSTIVNQNGGSFGWGWELQSTGDGAGTIGNYYVKLPEAEQRVLYAADGSGYHGAVAVNTSDRSHTHSTQIALGERALQLDAQQRQPQLYQLHNNNPVDIYLIQQQYLPPITGQHPQPEPFLLPASSSHLPHYHQLTNLYNVQTNHQTQNHGEYNANNFNRHSQQTQNVQNPNIFNEHMQHQRSDDSREQNRDNSEPISPVVQVFKDHNCSDAETEAKKIEDDIKKSKELLAEEPSYNLRNINGNFGIRQRNPVTYTRTVNFKVRPNARSEKEYQITKDRDNKEGIRKLVESTQDLITNDDLLKINHALEHQFNEQSEDLIKPKPRFTFRGSNNYETLNTSPTQITVRTKISNILNSEVEHLENDTQKESVLQSNSNDYNFASPIIVADFPKTEKEQIFNNIVSTMVPYLQNGYEIVNVQKYDNYNNKDEATDATPRPVSQNYLAPITVAIRLINDNATNSLEDHETSDSEIVSETVEIPEKTTVEVQESIPVEITHINSVETHEYMDEGRSIKGPIETIRNLYGKYVDSLKKSRKLSDNINKILNNYEEETKSNQSYKDENDNSKEESEPLEQSENIQSQVEVNSNGDTGQKRSEYYYTNGNYPNDGNYYTQNYETDSQKIIQPIVIEKEVPVTKFVDRFIEKQVPYSETLTVPVPIDRPVPVPIPVEKVVEKPVEVTKYVDKPYPVEIPRPYPVEVKVPYPVEQKVYVDRPVHVPYHIEKVVEKQIVHPYPVPTPIAVPVEVQVPVEQQVLLPIEVEKPVPIPVEVPKPYERIVHKEVPVPYPVEKKAPYPVHYETKVPVPYAVEKRVPVPQPVPVPVHFHHPYPVDRIVERKVPYPVHVEKIVEKKVPIRVPYPVEKIVEKIVEKPVIVTKYVDKPYPVEKRVPYPVEKIVERKVPYAVHVPIEVKVPYAVEKIVEKPVHLPIIYRYRHENFQQDESKNNLQYQLPDKQKIQNQLHEFLKDMYQPNGNIQTTHWGNRYASSYQFINTDDGKRGTNNNQRNPNPTLQNRNNYADINKNPEKQRQPKVVNIEYGGFKPPLRPSTEVDLDGMPVKKSE